MLHHTDFRLLLLANLLAPLGTALVSPLLDSLIQPFGTTATNIGLMVAVFSAPGIVVTPLVGLIADRYGRKPVIMAGLLVFGLAGTGIALTTDFLVVLTLRLLQGFGFAGLVPIIITSIGDLYSDATEATAQGLRFTSSGLSQGVFPLLGGTLVIVGWQYPFFLYSFTIPVAGMVYLWFDEPTDVATEKMDSENEITDSHGQQLLRFASQRRVAAVLVARSTPPLAWIGFLTYNSIIVVGLLDGTPRQAGILVTLGSFSYAISGSQAGRLTSLFARRRHPLVGGHALLGVGFAIVGVAGSVLVASIGALLLGIGLGITLTLYRSIITGFPPAALRGGLVSISESFGRTTTTLTPIAMGALIAATQQTAGFESAVRWTAVAFGLAAGGGGILALTIASRSPSPAQRPVDRHDRS